MPEWSPESENDIPYTYEQALADVERTASDALRIATRMHFQNDRFVTALFMELLLAKQEAEAA